MAGEWYTILVTTLDEALCNVLYREGLTLVRDREAIVVKLLDTEAGLSHCTSESS